MFEPDPFLKQWDLFIHWQHLEGPMNGKWFETGFEEEQPDRTYGVEERVYVDRMLTLVMEGWETKWGLEYKHRAWSLFSLQLRTFGT